MSTILFTLVVSLAALIYGAILVFKILHLSSGDEKMQKIAKAIYDGANAFLNKEYRVLIYFVGVVFILLYLFLSSKVAVAFVLGSVLSALAGNIGMRVATKANVRAAQAIKESIKKGLNVAFDSGSVMGLAVVSFGLLGIIFIYWLWPDPNILFGFGFGASAIALFARVGGGIYTKAADVGADLVGKIEAGIPEDDSRNPAVIADNVGDNVGDVAGMGADLFESFVDSIIAAMALGIGGFVFRDLVLGESQAISLPLLLASLGLIASLIGNIFVKLIKTSSPSKNLNWGLWSATGFMVLFAFLINNFIYHNLLIFWALVSGLLGGVIIGWATEFFTSAAMGPTKQIAFASRTGAATNIISGISLGMKSTIAPILIVSASILISYFFVGIYGVAIAAVGMLSTLGISLATDTYGPVADNAAGIAQMAGLGKEVRSRAEQLDAVGNTTAAIGKGFAIGSAALTALVLLVSYGKIVGLAFVDLLSPRVLVGLFIGGLMPFVFSAFTISSVGKAAIKMVQEVRRQFKEMPGIMTFQTEPDYKKAVAINTQAAIREMILPAILAITIPIVIGFLLGKESLAGLLGGSIVTGFLLAVFMANSGGAWDNAKKFIEAGNLGGKGSDVHKAAVTGDTVGDPFKDTAGPSLNILIKLMSIVAIIIASLLI